MVKALVTGMLFGMCAWGWVLGWKDATMTRTVYVHASDVGSIYGYPAAANLNKDEEQRVRANAHDHVTDDFSIAFVTDRACKGLRLQYGSESVPVPANRWDVTLIPDIDLNANENDYDSVTWMIDRFHQSVSQNDTISPSNEKSAKTVAHAVCEIVKGNGGSIQ
jgi:hypothetical protein